MTNAYQILLGISNVFAGSPGNLVSPPRGMTNEEDLLYKIYRNLVIGAAAGGGGGGSNIYSADGTLTGNRTLSGASNSLIIQDISIFAMLLSSGTYFNVTSSDIGLSSAGAGTISLSTAGGNITSNAGGGTFQIQAANIDLVNGSGLGAKYANSLSYQNITWATDDDYIPSIGMIKANVGSSNIYSTDDALTGNRALDGDGYSLDLGTAASQLSTFNTEAIGKSVITSGSGTTTSFLSIEKGVQTRLLHQSNVNSIGGSILWNNYGSFDLRNKTNAARMSMIGDIAGNMTWKNEDLARGQFAGVILDPISDKASLFSEDASLDIFVTTGLKVNTPTSGLGLSYNDYTVDEANVGAWGTEDNHIPSEARIIGNTAKIKTAVTAPATPYSAVSGDVILWDATAGAKTVNLPAAASNTNVKIDVKKLDSSGNAITIDGNASETIDGATTITLTTQYESVTLFCDGFNWHII